MPLDNQVQNCILSQGTMHVPTVLHTISVSRPQFKNMGLQSLPSRKLLPRFALNSISPSPETGLPGTQAFVPSRRHVICLCVFLLHWCLDTGRKNCACFGPLEPNAGAGPGGPLGNVKCTSRHVSFCKVHCWRVTVEWEPSRAFLLDARPCLFARMKAASSRSVALG